MVLDRRHRAWRQHSPRGDTVDRDELIADEDSARRRGSVWIDLGYRHRQLSWREREAGLSRRPASRTFKRRFRIAAPVRFWVSTLTIAWRVAPKCKLADMARRNARTRPTPATVGGLRSVVPVELDLWWSTRGRERRRLVRETKRAEQRAGDCRVRDDGEYATLPATRSLNRWGVLKRCD